MNFDQNPSLWLRDLLLKAGLTGGMASFITVVVLVASVLVISWLSNLTAKLLIRTIVTRIVRRTKTVWDDIFLEEKVFTRLSHFVPAIVMWFMAGWILKDYHTWLLVVRRFTYMYMLVAGAVVLTSFAEAWYKVYLTLPISEHRSIKGYVQIVKLIIFVIFGLLIVSVVFGKSVTTIIAGLGFMASVLMLIFKDAILGLVASIQLSADHMVKIGDWITIPSREVDGEVSDITLTTVKVKNFDKTIVTVPVYSLVNESFQNWVGMQDSGVRQIKRRLYIDVKSIRFADKELAKKIQSLDILRDAFQDQGEKGLVVLKDNIRKSMGYFSSGQMTNLGYFRLYAEAYLRKHPMIDKKQTIIVRHREADGNGIPLQVYAFTNKTDFETYENVQSEIFEHLLTMTGEFGLKVFQAPAGEDILTINRRTQTDNN